MKMLDFGQNPEPVRPSQHLRGRPSTTLSKRGSQSLVARVKPERVNLYPGVDPEQWYRVVQEGEYTDDMKGLWIEVAERVTYVLAKHFDLQTRPEAH